MWLIMWAWSRTVEAMLLAGFVLFLSPAMPNLYRNTDRNTSTRYKAIIQFRRVIKVRAALTKHAQTFEPLFVFADEGSNVVFYPSS